MTALPLGMRMIIPVGIAFALFLVLRMLEFSSGKHRYAILSGIPLLVGVLLGLKPLQLITDSLYLDLYNVSDRSKMLHYATFYLPLGLLVALIVWQIMRERRHKLEQ